MRSVNFDSIQATGDGGFTPLPAGPYVARLTELTDVDEEANRKGYPNNPPKEYVVAIYDIAEGEHAGYYGDDWGKSHPYAHRIILSYKDSALGMLKGRLEAIAKSNPGFDPFVAWNAGRLDMFVGRIVGINLQEEEYERNDGDTGTRLNVCQMVDAQLVRDGKIKPREKKALGGGRANASRPSSGQVVGTPYGGPIPFD